MDDLAQLIAFHRPAERLGPGGEAQTRLALSLSGLYGRRDPIIADIGCGTGAASLVLARETGGRITAVDRVPQFLEELETRARTQGLEGRISTLCAPMQALPFEPEGFDAIWSEGAIYNMGFEAGLTAWRSFLKPDGVIAVSDLCWLTQTRPASLEAHWTNEYPGIGTVSERMATIEACGYSPLGYFPLPAECWLENYYGPMKARFEAFLLAHDNEAARRLVAAEQEEIRLYETSGQYFGYGFYIARKAPA